MILLDTNYLIRMLVQGTTPAAQVSEWLELRTPLVTSSVCWYEFMTGPVDEEGTALVLAALQDRIIPFTADHAQEAARLYNACGRNRRQRVDAMNAAVSILSNAALATENREDFLPFVSLGLRMIDHLPQRSYTSSHDR